MYKGLPTNLEPQRVIIAGRHFQSSSHHHEKHKSLNKTPPRHIQVKNLEQGRTTRVLHVFFCSPVHEMQSGSIKILRQVSRHPKHLSHSALMSYVESMDQVFHILLEVNNGMIITFSINISKSGVVLSLPSVS